MQLIFKTKINFLHLKFIFLYLKLDVWSYLKKDTDSLILEIQYSILESPL